MKKTTLLIVCCLSILSAQGQFAAVHDGRNMGTVSPVKDQGSCGACWAFASIATIESNWLKSGFSLSVLSEDNIIDCHGFDEGPCVGGSYYMVSALLSRHDGPLLLVDDPYTPTISNCPLSMMFPPQKPALVEEIRWLPPQQSVIKQAIMDYGSVATAMFFTMANYNTTSYKYYDALIDASDSLNAHCVSIAGWNDTMSFPGAPGPGGWIIKDSYGTSWAQNGYFYISYYDAGILSDNVVFPVRREMPPSSNQLHVYYNDFFGWVDNYGYNSNIAYALVYYKIMPSGGVVAPQQLKRIGTYAVEDGTTIDVEIYRTKSGNVLSNLVTSVSTYCTYKGFYTLPLNLRTDTLGSDFYIRVKYTGPPAALSPVPIETYEAGHTSAIVLSSNSGWVSANGSSWSLVGQGTSYAFDPCIKLYTENAPIAAIAALPDTICMGTFLMLNASVQPTFDSLQWRIDGITQGIGMSLPLICDTPGLRQIQLIAYWGHNTDTANTSVMVMNTDTNVTVFNSILTSQASGAQYQWLDCNNAYSPLAGENGQSFLATGDGSYAVEVRNWQCVDTSACHTIINAGMITHDPAAEQQLWPNPSDGRISINLSDNSFIEVLDPRGILLFQYTMERGEALLDLSSLSNGVYFIRISKSNSSTTTPVIIVH